MDATNTNKFSKGTRVGIAAATGASAEFKGTVTGRYFTHRDDIVMVHWDHHDEGRDLVMNTGNLRVLDQEAA